MGEYVQSLWHCIVYYANDAKRPRLFNPSTQSTDDVMPDAPVSEKNVDAMDIDNESGQVSHQRYEDISLTQFSLFANLPRILESQPAVEDAGPNLSENQRNAVEGRVVKS